MTGCAAGDSDDTAQFEDDTAAPELTAPDTGGNSLTLITEPDDGLDGIDNLIKSATKTIDMTMYELTDTTVTSLLTAAQAKGIAVRVILDQKYEMTSNTPAYTALTAGKVGVHWANVTLYEATHQKTITVDGKTSAIMTLNLTPRYYPTGRDFALITNNAADVAAIENVFEADYAGTAITPPTGANLVWSPTNAKASMADVINQATKTLVIENEEMSDAALIAALSAAVTRGVDVEVIMTKTSYATELAQLKTAGVKVSTYVNSTKHLYIHAKIVLADYGTSAATMFLGSENFSVNSLGRNRECGLVIDNATIMKSVNTTLAADFTGGVPL